MQIREETGWGNTHNSRQSIRECQKDHFRPAELGVQELSVVQVGCHCRSDSQEKQWVEVGNKGGIVLGQHLRENIFLIARVLDPCHDRIVKLALTHVVPHTLAGLLDIQAITIILSRGLEDHLWFGNLRARKLRVRKLL